MLRLSNVVTCLFLALCVALAATWALAAQRGLGANPAPVQRSWHFEATAQGLRFIHAARSRPRSFTWFIGGNMLEPNGLHRKVTPEGDLHSFADGSARTVPKEPATWAGFQWNEGAATDGPKGIDDEFKLWMIPWRAVTIPYPFLLALAALFPLIRLALFVRRRRRVSRGLCRACGYDVRFSPRRCPECGLPTSMEHGAEAAAQPR